MNWVKNGGHLYTLISSDCTPFGGNIDQNIVEFTCTNNGKDLTMTFKEVKKDQDGERWSCNIDSYPETVSAEVTIKIKGRLIFLI